MNEYDRLVDAAKLRTQEILALPPEQRDARYAQIRAEHMTIVAAQGLPDHAAQELVEQMDEAIRRLVDRAENP